MGTAHGDIKIDSDTRGVDKAEASVDRFADAIKSLNDAAMRFQTAADKIDSALDQITRNYDQADRAAQKFNRDADSLTISINRQGQAAKRTGDAHREASGQTKDWASSAEMLASKLVMVNVAMAEMEQIGQRVSKMSKSFSDLGGPVGIGRSLLQVGGAKTGLKLLEANLLGIDKALQNAPNWQKSILGTANSLKLLTFGVASLTSLSTYSTVWTKAAGLMAKASVDTGAKMLLLGDRVGNVAGKIEKFAAPIMPAIDALKRFNSSLDGFAGGAAKAVTGMALIRSGMSGLNSSFGIFGKNFQTGSYFLDMFIRGLKFVFLPGIVLSSAAMEAFGKTLEMTSNLVAGLWNGIEQLSGGLLALPGLFAVIGAAAGTGMVIFSNLKTQLKTIASAKGDIDKINAAIAAMPPYLRPLGQAVVDLTPKWKQFQDTLTDTFIQGAAEQLRGLANNVLPLLTTGSIQVANSFRNGKDAILGFVGQGKTIGTMLQIFGNTAQILYAVGGQIDNIAGGFRDLAGVGSTFIRQLAEDYLPVIGAKFRDWATNASASGKAMMWMDQSVVAAKALVTGVVQATEAVYNLLTVFKTPGSDQNFLSKFAAEMTKFNNEIKSSETGGILKRIGDDVRAWDTSKLKDLKNLFKDAVPGIKAAYQILQDMSKAFSGTMLPAVQALTIGVSGFVQALNFAGAGTVIGTVLGIAGAFKILMMVMSPLFNIIKIVMGALALKSGAEVVILGIAAALDKMGTAGEAASMKLLGVGDSIASFAAIAGGVVVGLLVLWQAFDAGQQTMNDYDKSLTDSAKATADFKEKLATAFTADKATPGKNVFDTVNNQVTAGLGTLKENASKVPGIMANIGGWISGGMDKTTLQGSGWDKFVGEFFAQSDKFNAAQKNYQDADKASAAFDRMGKSSQQLTDILESSQGTFDQFQASLKASGDGGNEAAAQMQKWRDAYVSAMNDAKASGPGALALADGIKKLAQAGGDAQTKLEGLKESLQGLGLLKTDDYQAVADYAKAVQGLGDAAASAADGTQPFNDVIDKQSGLLNAWSVNGRNLLNVLQPVAENFLNLASRGHDVGAMWDDMQPQLQKVADDFHLTKDQVDKLIASMGVDPKIVKILVQLEGQDAIHQDMAKILATAAANVGNGVKVPVSIDTPENAAKLAADLNKLFHSQAATSQGSTLFLSPNIRQSEVDAITGNYGANTGPNLPNQVPGLPGQAVPQPPAGGPPMPVAPAPAPDKVEKPKAGGEKAPDKLPKNFAGLGIPSPLLPGSSPAGKQGGPAPVLSWQPPADDPNAPVVPVAPAPAPAPPPAASAPAPAPAPSAPAPQTPQLNVAPMGLDALAKSVTAVQAAAADIQKAWQGLTDAIAKSLGDALTAVNTFATKAIGVLNKAGDDAKKSGTAFGMDFAAGINSPASLNAIDKAAIAAANEAKKKMPGSPAEEGPLSGDGWSGIAGKHFSEDFAGGISSGVSNISSSAKQAAAAAKIVFAGLTKGVPDDSKNFLKQFQDLTALASNFQKVFTQTFNTGAKFLQSMSDPFKTGGFFGTALPYQRDKKVTDADLANKQQGGDEGVGRDLLGGAASLKDIQAPNKDDVAAAIVGEAQKRGYDRNTAIGALSAVMQEDNSFNPGTTNASGHKGLFQESADKQPGDAQNQINWFFNQLDQLGGPGSAGLKADPLDVIATQIERGGYGGASLAQHAPDATKLYDQVLGKAGTAGVGPDAAFSGAQGYVDNPASRAKETAGHSDVEQGAQAIGLPGLYDTSGPNAYKLPQWMNDLADKFGLKASTYSSGGSLHQMGFAADFMGDPKMMEAFAQYIRTNLQGQTLQLIHQGASGQKYGIASGQEVGPGTSQPGYYGANWQEEGSMVHWATDVAPLIGNSVAGAENGQNQQVLQALRQNNSSLDNAIKIGQNPTSTDQQVTDSLQTIKQASIEANQGNTPESKQNAKALDSVASTISGNRGMTQTQDPISSAQGVIGGASQIAGDVIGDINDTIQAIGATKNTADMLVRGIANTQDVMKIIDNTQQWLSTFAQYAQTVGDVANEVGQVANAASEGEPGGGSIAGIAGIIGGVADAISGALQGVNEAIDVAQELYQIWGSYYGNFLGFLSGGNNSLQGNVQYLLDQNTQQLLAYSTDNPMLKNALPVPGQITNPAANNQAIGQLNYYAGPGTDPREATRQMMFQVKASSFAGATAS